MGIWTGPCTGIVPGAGVGMFAGITVGGGTYGVVGAGEIVGEADLMETLAQLKNCSGHTSDLVPSDG